ncbi:hypothetical protein [Pseudomonas sp. Sample_22]|uniref:OB-fold protein n=1 Tax=Pseudomonas sp. Sample_22 TaxID=2448266 RepID=UPI001032D4C7|nr:hypothetical protein [Pseudomonas sp. Sample_22]
MAKLTMQNELTGEFKDAPIGLSWTTLFFGFFPALIRKDWTNALILAVFGPLSLGLLFIIYWLSYNKLYINELLKNGYKISIASDSSAINLMAGITPSLANDAIFNATKFQAQKFKLRFYSCSVFALIAGLGLVNHIHTYHFPYNIIGESPRDSALHAAATIPPEVISKQALNFTKNILAEDITATLSGVASLIPEFAPKAIGKPLNSLELSHIYNSNQVMANRKLKNKTIIITGEVISISATPTDTVLIGLQSANESTNIVSELSKPAERAVEALRTGDTITLVCVVEGIINPSISLGNCQPLTMFAEAAAEAQVIKLENWLSHGGKSPFEFDPNVSNAMALLYFLGTVLPEGHTCRETIDWQKCTSAFNLKKIFDTNGDDINQCIDRWREWLQLPKSMHSA